MTAGPVARLMHPARPNKRPTREREAPLLSSRRTPRDSLILRRLTPIPPIPGPFSATSNVNQRNGHSFRSREPARAPRSRRPDNTPAKGPPRAFGWISQVPKKSVDQRNHFVLRRRPVAANNLRAPSCVTRRNITQPDRLRYFVPFHLASPVGTARDEEAGASSATPITRGPRYADCKRVKLLWLTIYARHQHQFVGSFFQLPGHRLTLRCAGVANGKQSAAADAN